MPRLTEGWQQTSLLDAIFDHISDALIVYDNNRVIRGVNRAAEKLFGMAADEMVGNPCGDVFRCGICEPGCGVLVGLSENYGSPTSAVRLQVIGKFEKPFSKGYASSARPATTERGD